MNQAYLDKETFFFMTVLHSYLACVHTVCMQLELKKLMLIFPI